MENPKKRKQPLPASSSDETDDHKQQSAQRSNGAPASAQKQKPQPQQQQQQQKQQQSASKPARPSSSASDETVKRPRVSQPPTSSSKTPQGKQQQQQQKVTLSGKKPQAAEEDNDDDVDDDLDDDEDEDEKQEEKKASKPASSSSSSSSSSSASVGAGEFEDEAVNYSFDSLEVSEATKKAITEMGFTRMTEVQARCIPTLLVRFCYVFRSMQLARCSHHWRRGRIRFGSPSIVASVRVFILAVMDLCLSLVHSFTHSHSLVLYIICSFGLHRKDATFSALPRRARARRSPSSSLPSSSSSARSSRRETVRSVVLSYLKTHTRLTRDFATLRCSSERNKLR